MYMTHGPAYVYTYRFLVQNMEQYSADAGSVQWHIEHKYSTEIAKQSDIVSY